MGTKVRSAEIMTEGIQEAVAAIEDGKAVGKNLGCLEAVRGRMARKKQKAASMKAHPKRLGIIILLDYFASEEKCIPHDKLCIVEHH